MFDLISIGDCVIDNFFKIQDAHVHFNIDKTRRELCVNYASKIAAENYEQMVGGNSANVVIGASRLGLKTGYYVNIGADTGGEKVLKVLKEEGVDDRYVKVHKDKDSNVSAVISFQGERTVLVYHQPWEYQLPDLEQTRWIYFSSLSSSFQGSNIVPQLENYLERTGSRLAFNPGTFQLKYGIKKYPKLLALTTILFVNIQEAQQILMANNKDRAEIKQLLRGLQSLGPQMVIITDGKKGSYGIDGKNIYKLDSFPARLIDMTGAGDAYASGVVSGLFHSLELPEAMRWGACNSASVVEKVGSQLGLLSQVEIQERLKKNAKITAKQL